MEVEDGNPDLVILLGFDRDIHQDDEKYQKDESAVLADLSQNNQNIHSKEYVSFRQSIMRTAKDLTGRLNILSFSHKRKPKVASRNSLFEHLEPVNGRNSIEQ